MEYRADDDSYWRRVVARLGVDLRPGEGFPAVMLFVYFFTILVFQYVTKSFRQAAYIDQLGAEALPLVYFLVAICSYPFLVLYGRFADRLPRHHLIAATSLVVAASCVGFWVLFRSPGQWVPVLFYVWISIAYVLIVSQAWSYSNHVFDPRQAKRLFGFIGAGALLGGMVGGQVAAAATRLVGATFGLLIAAALLVVSAALIYVIHALSSHDERRTAGVAGLAKLDEARGGMQIIRRSRHLQLIAAIMLLTVIVAQIVDVQFASAVERATSTLDQRTEFFGNFFFVMGLSAFVFQLLFTSRIHRRLGVGFALRVLPATMGVGTISLLAAFGFLPALLLPAALTLKIGENGLRYSLDQATRELLYLPVPSKARLKAKAYIDVFIQRSGKGFAAVLLLPVFLGWLPAIQAGWISLALIVVWLGVTVAMRRQFVSTFRDGLRAATVDPATPIDISDATSVEVLTESLQSSDVRHVARSLDLLAAHDRADAVPAVLLLHDDPVIRRRTLDVLARGHREDALEHVERLLGDPDAGVRAAAVQALSMLAGSDARDVMLPRLHDRDPRIRAAAITSVATDPDREVAQRAETALRTMIRSGDAEVRAAAAGAVAEVPDPVFQAQLVQLLFDSDEVVVRAAIHAAHRRLDRDGFNPVYAAPMITLLRHRRLKHDARAALVGCGEDVIPSLMHFVNDTREHHWVRRALPKTIAAIGTEGSTRSLVACLSSPDVFLRGKAIEALAGLDLEGTELDFWRDLLARHASSEAAGYLRHYVDLRGLGLGEGVRFEGPKLVWDDRGAPTLLHRLLSERMLQRLDLALGILVVLHDAEGVRAARHGLLGEDAALRTHALEYFDNTLTGDLKRSLFAVIEEVSARERLARARTLFDLEPVGRSETLVRIMSDIADDDPDAAWLAVAAIEAVVAERVEDVHDVVRGYVGAENPLLHETAAWAAERIGRAADDSALGRRGTHPGELHVVGPDESRRLTLSTMPRIEMVMFLQDVELLRYCSADEILRIAGITGEVRIASGEEIYDTGAPADRLFGLVEGEVVVEGPAGESRTVGSSETFGVVDILSGRVRGGTARASADSLLLVIEADDFFDLMSDSVEIVKAIFRTLTRTAPTSPLA